MVRYALYVLGLIGLGILFLLMSMDAFYAGFAPIPGARDMFIERHSRTLENLHARLKRTLWGPQKCSHMR